MKNENTNQNPKNRMKLWPFLCLTLTAVIISLAAGCSALGTDTSAPNAVEHALFTTTTNFVNVPVQVVVTNQMTNTITQFQTNTVGQIVTVTNIQILPQYQTIWETNVVPQYENTVSSNTTAVVNTAGGVLNTFFPGIGGIASTGVAALLALWAQLRSGKRQDTSAALSQEVETMLEFIKTLPQGTQYYQALTAFLQSHQVDAGVATQVLGLLENEVSNPDAKAAVAQILGTLTAVQSATAAKA